MSFIDQLFQNVIHERLKSHRRVCESEEHDWGLEQASVCSERRFPLITFFDLDVIVTPLDIHLCETLSLGEGLGVFGKNLG